MTQPTPINLHSNEFSQELRCIPFAVNFNRCAGSCTTLGNLSSRVCVPNEKQVFNLHVVYMITGINEPKTLTNHISCRCEFKFDNKKCNSNQKCNDYKCHCKCKNPREHHVYQKGLYLESCNMELLKWLICWKYYWQFNDYA